MSIRPALLPGGKRPAFAMLLSPRLAMGWAHVANISNSPSDTAWSKAAISAGLAWVLDPEAQAAQSTRDMRTAKKETVFIWMDSTLSKVRNPIENSQGQGRS